VCGEKEKKVFKNSKIQKFKNSKIQKFKKNYDNGFK
jgi:hypothetical protein